ncbi:MAG: hypothetical protein IKR31_07275 [Prevotella sp.]|nr:hypothetical protein [Prevotella sp.]
MEGKKKFEKPQMEVVKLKPAGIVCASCPTKSSCVCDNDCPWDGDW